MSINNNEKAERTLDMVNFWINNIDSKASYALTFAGVLLGFILIRGTPNAFLLWNNSTKITFPIFIGATMVSLLYIFSLTSICFFIIVLFARIVSPKKNKRHLYFGSIANFDLKQFTKEFSALPDNDYFEELIEQIYTNSCICSKKMKWYNRGTILLIVSIILCFICILFQLI